MNWIWLLQTLGGIVVAAIAGAGPQLIPHIDPNVATIGSALGAGVIGGILHARMPPGHPPTPTVP